MGLFDNLFSRDSKQEKKKVELYRANLFQKNIASQIEADSLEIAISFQHSLVNISAELFTIETLNGEHYSFPINFSEKDFSTTTYIGKFQNGRDFRLIQPTDLSLDMAKSNHNALGAFTLGSVNPSGWAVHLFLTDKDDIRQTNVSEKGSTEQIQKLIQGSMMGIQFGMPEKFVEFSKRLLPMVESNPSQLHNYENSSEFIQVMKSSLESYNDNEKNIINKIVE
jgi:hypothetical protein